MKLKMYIKRHPFVVYNCSWNAGGYPEDVKIHRSNNISCLVEKR